MRHNGSNGRSSRFSSLPVLPGWLLPVATIVTGSLALWGCDGGRVSFGDDAGKLGSTNGGQGGQAGGVAAGSAGGAGSGSSAPGGSAGAAGAAGSQTHPPVDVGAGNDPLDVHPWPMAHRSAGNQASGDFGVSAATPWPRWVTPVAAPGAARVEIRPLVDASGSVYVVTTNAVVIVRSDGVKIAEVAAQAPRGIALTKAGRLVISDDLGVSLVDLASPLTPLWRLAPLRAPGAWVASSPIVAPSGDVFVVDAGEDLVRIGGSTGAAAWRASLPAPAFTPALALSGDLYVAVSGPGNGVHAFDVNGTAWFTGFGSDLISPAVVDEIGQQVLIAARHDRLRTIPIGASSAAAGRSFPQSANAVGAESPSGALPVRSRIASPFKGSIDPADTITFTGTVPTWTNGTAPLALGIRLGGLGGQETYLGGYIEDDPFRRTSDRVSSPAGSHEGPVVLGTQAGGIELLMTDGSGPSRMAPHHASFRVDVDAGTPQTPPTPALGPGGDIFFVSAEGNLYRVATVDNPCLPGAYDVGDLTLNRQDTDVAIGETLTVQKKLGSTPADALATTITVDGAAVPLVLPVNVARRSFVIPPMALPLGGRMVDITIQTPTQSVSFCRRIIPARITRGAAPTITGVTSPGAAPGDVPTLSKGLVIAGTHFLGTAPLPSSFTQFDGDPLQVSVCTGEGRPVLAGTSGDLTIQAGCFECPIKSRLDGTLKLECADYAELPVFAPLIAEGEIPLVATVTSRWSGHPAASFAFRGRLVP